MIIDHGNGLTTIKDHVVDSASKFHVSFKRATFLLLSVQQDTTDTRSLELEYRKGNTKEWIDGRKNIYPAIESDLVNYSDSGSYRTFSNHTTIERDIDYEISMDHNIFITRRYDHRKIQGCSI